MRIRALAKLNLDLRVLNKRPDGFHELLTIFQTISLSDTIDIEVQRGRTRIEIDSDIPDNLIIRAALPALLKKPIPLETLIQLATQLGSDVPFFLAGGAAVALGRGTEVYPLPDL